MKLFRNTFVKGMKLYRDSVSMGERKQNVYSLMKYINKSYLNLYRCFCVPFHLAVSVRFKASLLEKRKLGHNRTEFAKRKGRQKQR